MPRPAHVPTDRTRAQVEVLAAVGTPQEVICEQLGICVETLVKHYDPELKHGLAKANAKVAANLFRMATGQGREALGAACFWMKTRAGWRETNVVAVQGGEPGTPPVRVENVQAIVSGMNDGELHALEKVAKALLSNAGEREGRSGVARSA